MRRKRDIKVVNLLPQFPAFLTLLTPAGALVWCNRIGYGLTPKIMGRPAADLVHPEDRPAWADAVRRAAHQRETVEFAVRFVTPEGTVTIAGHMRPVVERGRVAHVAAVGRDVGLSLAGNPLLPFLFTPRSRAVVAAVLEHGPMKSSALAKRLANGDRVRVAPSTLRATLGALCERHVLTVTPAGYDLSESFRPHAHAAVRRQLSARF